MGSSRLEWAFGFASFLVWGPLSLRAPMFSFENCGSQYPSRGAIIGSGKIFWVTLGKW